MANMRIVPLLLVMIGLLFGTVAFGSEPVVIRIVDIDNHWGPVAEEFNRLHDNIRVEFEHVAGNWYQLGEKVKVEMASGVGPDIGRLGIMIVSDFRDTDLSLDLMPFIERDPDFSLDDLFSASWQYHMKDGRLSALPVFLHVLANFANVDIYNEAGVALPSLDWQNTWTEDEFVEINQKVSRMREFQLMGTNVEWHPHRWLHNLWRNGADFFIEEDGKLRSGLADPRAIDAVQWLADLMWEHDAARRPDRPALFSQGQLANLLDGTWLLQGETYRVVSFDWVATPLPMGSAGNATSLYPDPLVVFSSTKHPEEAWEVVKFFMSERAAEILRVGIPSRREAAIRLLPDLLSRQPLENKMVIVDALAFAMPPPVTPNWREIVELVEREVAPIRDGAQPAASVLPEIARKIDLLLAELY